MLELFAVCTFWDRLHRFEKKIQHCRHQNTQNSLSSPNKLAVSEKKSSRINIILDNVSIHKTQNMNLFPIKVHPYADVLYIRYIHPVNVWYAAYVLSTIHIPFRLWLRSTMITFAKSISGEFGKVFNARFVFSVFPCWCRVAVNSSQTERYSTVAMWMYRVFQ